MNIFHYILIGIILLGFFASKDHGKNDGNPSISKKARLIITLLIIGIVVLSAHF